MIGRMEYEWCRAIFHSTDIIPTLSFPNELFHTLFENSNFVCVPPAVYKRRRIISVKRSVADRLYERLWIGTFCIGNFGKHQQAISFPIYRPIVGIITNVVVDGAQKFSQNNIANRNTLRNRGSIQCIEVIEGSITALVPNLVRLEQIIFIAITLYSLRSRLF